jgi:hypothetical protein
MSKFATLIEIAFAAAAGAVERLSVADNSTM